MCLDGVDARLRFEGQMDDGGVCGRLKMKRWRSRLLEYVEG